MHCDTEGEEPLSKSEYLKGEKALLRAMFIGCRISSALHSSAILIPEGVKVTTQTTNMLNGKFLTPCRWIHSIKSSVVGGFRLMMWPAGNLCPLSWCTDQDNIFLGNTGSRKFPLSAVFKTGGRKTLTETNVYCTLSFSMRANKVKGANYKDKTSVTETSFIQRMLVLILATLWLLLAFDDNTQLAPSRFPINHVLTIHVSSIRSNQCKVKKSVFAVVYTSAERLLVLTK